MASEWTPQEIRAAEEEIDDTSNTWKPWREITTEVICQRNRALEEAMNAKMCWSRADTIGVLRHLNAAIAACGKGGAR